MQGDDEELQRIADELARATVVVSNIEAVLTGRMALDTNMDTDLACSRGERIGTADERRAVVIGDRHQDWR